VTPPHSTPRERARRIVQISILAVFLIITVVGPMVGLGLVASQTLSRLDPLIGLAATIASRGFVLYALAALLTVVLSVVFGRAWCGWVCPMGTLLDTVPARKRTLQWARSPLWRFGKYAVLTVVVGAAVAGSLSPMVLDPVTMATRPAQELVLPYVGGDAVGMAVGVDLGRSGLATVACLSLVPLAAVLGLNAIGKRVWCRSLCPLGALLALISLVPGVRRSVDANACTSCGRCARDCPTLAIAKDRAFASSDAECVVCMKCSDACPTDAIHFLAPGARTKLALTPGQPEERQETPPEGAALGSPRRSLGLDRREAVTLAGLTGASLAIAAVLPTTAIARDILRPPGTDEARLAQRCVRCGACYSACPTGILRPSTSVLSRGGLWTPMLDEKPQYCTLNCNRCARVCPTDALHVPTTNEAIALGLGGVARVDRTRCIAWARGHDCMRCLAVCPMLGAVYYTEETSPMWHDPSPTRVPHVNPEFCVACGLCTGVCPAGPPAIQVVPN
jgi:ferredoxin